MKTISARRAFTLIELLVVILILGILLSLLMPGMANVWRIARKSQCAQRLSNLGKAYRSRASDEALGTIQAFEPKDWTTQLLPYLENNGDWLLCPEGGEFTPSASIAELFEFKVIDDLGTWYIPATEGTYVVKLSDTQYRDAKSKGLLTKSATDLRSKFDCTYRPDDNPNLYWLCLEDHWGDFDFTDVIAKVTTRDDGTTQLLFTSNRGGSKCSLISTKDGSELIYVPSNCSNLETVVQAHGSATSYGLNLAVGEAGSSAGDGKILVMDYFCYLIDPLDDWTRTTVDSNGDDVPDFARHQGTVNILFTDNSVTAHDPLDFDPTTPSIERQFWTP